MFNSESKAGYAQLPKEWYAIKLYCFSVGFRPIESKFSWIGIDLLNTYSHEIYKRIECVGDLSLGNTKRYALKYAINYIEENYVDAEIDLHTNCTKSTIFPQTLFPKTKNVYSILYSDNKRFRDIIHQIKTLNSEKSYTLVERRGVITAQDIYHFSKIT